MCLKLSVELTPSSNSEVKRNKKYSKLFATVHQCKNVKLIFYKPFISKLKPHLTL